MGGRPKGLLSVAGRRIVDRVADALAEATGSAPVLVANTPDASRWRPDLRVIGDRIPGAGALGGVHAALTDAGGLPVLCVAWDLPFLPAALLTTLIAEAEPFDAFLPESGGPRGMEPLCAVYAPACRPAIEGALAAGDHRVIAFHDAVRVGTLPLARVRAFGDPARIFFNVNTPEDLERAERPWPSPA